MPGTMVFLVQDVHKAIKEHSIIFCYNRGSAPVFPSHLRRVGVPEKEPRIIALTMFVAQLSLYAFSIKQKRGTLMGEADSFDVKDEQK